MIIDTIDTCYGQYSKTRTKCKSCTYNVWCRDATALTQSRLGTGHDDYRSSEAISSAPAQWADKDESSIPHKILGELLDVLQDNPGAMTGTLQLLNQICGIHRSNPRCFHVLITKILHPDRSYQVIADQEHISKQLVAYYLKRGKALIPQLGSAILVDRRRLPQLAGRKTLTYIRKQVGYNGKNLAMLKWIKEKYGSIREFSRVSGIGRATIQSVVNGAHVPRVETRRRVADAIGLTLAEMEKQFQI